MHLPRPRPLPRAIAAVVAVVLVSGCSGLTGACTDDLQFELSPTASTLAVGQSATARAGFRGCRGSRRLDDRITWRSANPAVARVDSLTGVITGVAPGSTVVEARGDRYGAVPPGVQVRVQ